MKLLQRCRKRAAEDELPLRQIFDDACRSSGDIAGHVAFAEVESSLYKQRRTAMPTLPTNAQESDAAVSGSRFAVIDQSPFYRGQVTSDDGGSALVFTTDGQLELLRSAHVIYIDATFRVVPSLYHQLFTIFVPHADYSFPVCFALMTRKTTALYDAVMRKVQELQPLFRPTQVIADFEEAPATAVRNVFGNTVVISGCWFHYAQALIKRLRKLGLTDAYRHDDETQTTFRCLLSLPLLPAGDIVPAFQEIKNLITDNSSSTAATNQLFRYVERQWLNKASIGASRLSVRDNPSRTNNSLESFHAALRRRIKVAHPNLFTFLGHLQRTTIDSQADICRLNRGMAIRRAKKRSNIHNDSRIKTCIRRFDDNGYSRVQFLRAVSHSMGAHSSNLCETPTDSDSETSADDADANTNAVVATVATPATDSNDCEVCLVAQRDPRIALVPCGHQRFCETCANEVERQSRGCPICRTDIQMILRLF